MNRIIRFAAITAAIVFCFITAAQAADSYFELNGFGFSISDEGKAAIRSYSGDDTDVVIPNKLLRAPVERIDNYAFYENAALTSISFTQAASLNSIGSCAFYGCSSLGEVSLPAQVTLSFGSFENCSGLQSLTIAEGISEIPEQCFYHCPSLTQIDLPASVTTIGVRAFDGCTALQSISLSENVVSIAPNAFEGCNDLVIYCQQDSYALEYAIENHIRFVITDLDPEIHSYYLRGDADGDNAVTVLDETVIERKLASLSVKSFDERAADVDGDGLNILDVTHIQRYLAKFNDPYHIGELVIIE